LQLDQDGHQIELAELAHYSIACLLALLGWGSGSRYVTKIERLTDS
jgi:hypothetical protein